MHVSPYEQGTRYRGLVEIKKNAINSFAHVECDTLILDSISRSDTVPIEKFTIVSLI